MNGLLTDEEWEEYREMERQSFIAIEKLSKKINAERRKKLEVHRPRYAKEIYQTNFHIQAFNCA